MSQLHGSVAETVPAMVRASAERHASCPAVVDADGSVLDYAGLIEAADRVAAAVVEAGVRPGHPVGVRYERGAALVAAWLGIGFAGGVYVPLSPDDPAERTDALLDQVGVAVLLDQGCPRPVHRLGVTARSLTAEGPPAERPLYVMFTSGSTGRPKAVVVPQRAVPRLVLDPTFTPFAPGDRVAFASNQMFDAATWEVWGPLLCGAAVVTVPRTDLLDHRRLAALLRERAVSHLMLTTSLFDRHCRSDPTMFGTLHSLIVGGEPLDPVTIREVLRGSHPPRELINGYGPTEATTFSTHHRVLDVPDAAPRVPIGRPIEGTTVAIVDDDGRSCPPGQAGELWIGGPGVALGYLDDPRGTDAKFVDVLEAVDGGPPVGRWYRSGDLAVADADGLLDCLGRLDEQVKIYGYRIEPAEVEAAVVALPEVAACAVLAEHDGATHRLVAYVVAADGDTVDPGSVRGALAHVLPRYLVPHLVVVVDDLPLTPNGKLDRNALAAMPRRVAHTDDADSATDGFDAIARPATALVATGWRRVLGHGDFGPDDDFDEVGGDSMALIELVTWLGQVSRADATSMLASAGPLTVNRMGAELERSVAGRSVRGQAVRGWPSMPPLVSWSAGPGPLLALLPAAGGTIFGSRWLAGELSAEFRVVAGNAIGLDGKGPAVRSIGDSARRWLEEWDAAGLDAPDVLVGFSSGAVLAHEVAARLRRDGRRRLIVLVDPPSDVGCRSWLRAQAERVPHDRRAVRHLLAVAARRVTRRPLTLDLAVGMNTGTVIRQVHHHRPVRMADPTLLLVADRRDDVGMSANAVRDAMVRRWTPWCADLRVEWVEGTHLGADSVVGRVHAAATARAIVEAATALGMVPSAVEADAQQR